MSLDPSSDLARFHKSYAALADGCWHWQKSVTHDGYGRFGIGSRKNNSFKLVSVHCWAYEQLIGPIPEGTELDHLCRNRACVNPAHLEPVTHLENVNRGRSANRERMVCIAGHDLANENLYVTPDGKRMCKECGRRRSLEYRRRLRSAGA